MQFKSASVNSVDIMGWPDPVMCLAGSYFSLNDDRQGPSPQPLDCPKEFRHLTSSGAVSAASRAARPPALHVSDFFLHSSSFGLHFFHLLHWVHYSSWFHFFFLSLATFPFYCLSTSPIFLCYFTLSFHCPCPIAQLLFLFVTCSLFFTWNFFKHFQKSIITMLLNF